MGQSVVLRNRWCTLSTHFVVVVGWSCLSWSVNNLIAQTLFLHLFSTGIPNGSSRKRAVNNQQQSSRTQPQSKIMKLSTLEVMNAQKGNNNSSLETVREKEDSDEGEESDSADEDEEHKADRILSIMKANIREYMSTSDYETRKGVEMTLDAGLEAARVAFKDDKVKALEKDKIVKDEFIKKVTETISENVIKLFGSKEEFKSLGNIASMISTRVGEEIRKNATRDELLKSVEGEANLEEIHDEETHFVRCEDCYHFKNNKNIPTAIKNQGKHPNWGIFVIKNRARNRQFYEKIRRHKNSPLHIECYKRHEEKKKKQKQTEEEEDEMCTSVITNSLFICGTPATSSRDFVRQMDKDNISTSHKMFTPQKNDGKNIYFELRKEFHAEMEEQVAKLMKEIRVIAVTLDKITVGNTAYTVLITFFFRNGKLCAYLNELKVMTSKDLDADGTADFVIDRLCKTLSLSKHELRERLEHFSYDGQYEVKENRPRGGGSYNLIHKVAEKLEMPPEMLTGFWDFGHNSQLTLADLMKDKVFGKIYQEQNNFIHKIIDRYTDNKRGMELVEVARELRQPFLKLVKHSDTRWSKTDLLRRRSVIRAVSSMVDHMGREQMKLMSERDNTKLKELDEIMKVLRSSEFWLRFVGMTQFLDMVTNASVIGQSSRKFSTTVMETIMDLKEELEKLGEKWVWKEEVLLHAQICPKEMIEHLRRGVLRPQVSDLAIKRRKAVLKLENEYFGNDEPEDEGIVIGETAMLPVEDFDIIELKVKGEMERCCQIFLEAFKIRVKTPTLIKNALAAFGSDFQWFEKRAVDHQQQFEEEQESGAEGGDQEHQNQLDQPDLAGSKEDGDNSDGRAVNNLQPIETEAPEEGGDQPAAVAESGLQTEIVAKARELLKGVYDEFHPCVKYGELSDFENLLEGYIEFIKHRRLNLDMDLETFYVKLRQLKDNEKLGDFCLLFEKVQIKTFSEVRDRINDQCNKIIFRYNRYLDSLLVVRKME